MHQIDVSKGQRIGTVSDQWASRPDDQKFLSLGDLWEQVNAWAEASNTITLAPKQIVATPSEDRQSLGIQIGEESPLTLSHYAFSNIARIAGAPANYLRTLPAPLAALNVNYGLRAAEQKEISAYMLDENGETHLRGITSPKYGRILDRDVVSAVMKIAGNGTGDTPWKVPGCIDWNGQHGVSYNPNVDITTQNTTLYASDRDVFLFLVDDHNPIEVGKLANGAPDLMFRGFYVWNSEVGDKTFGVATMYLRGVCQNRNLWGVEGFNELTFRHTSGAPDRFMLEAAPALASFTNAGTTKLIEGVNTAKTTKVAGTDEERIEFFQKFGFSQRQAKALIETSVAEEGHPVETAWDAAQAISAHARTIHLTEDRVALEAVAGRILDKATA